MFKRELQRESSVRSRHKRTSPYYSTFLFSDPSGLTGAGSIVSIGGNYYDFNYSDSEQEADHRAFEKDWEAVYDDQNTSFERMTKK